MNQRDMPEVNAGSMADIAFLLLIFFLVTTTLETNSGIKRMLPTKDGQVGVVMERNVLRIEINAADLISVENEVTDLVRIKELTEAFLDNGGAVESSERYCSYCRGNRSPQLSDNPEHAIVSIATSRQTSYQTFIAVQNEVLAAYSSLREREAEKRYQTSFSDMKAAYGKAKEHDTNRSALAEQIKAIQELYPIKLTEAELQIR